MRGSKVMREIFPSHSVRQTGAAVRVGPPNVPALGVPGPET